VEEEATAEDMEVATQVGIVVTQVATEEDILEVIPAAIMGGSQAARRRVAIS
jgi:hypothetical protein